MSILVKIIVIILVNVGVVSHQLDTTKTITVNISGLDNNNGKVMVGLYNAEGHFLKKEFMDASGQITDKKSIVVFKNVPTGIYAVSFVHDENDNGKMDTNFMGIPKEDYGCSNNAKGFMGPPKWNDAKFELKNEDKIINISI